MPLHRVVSLVVFAVAVIVDLTRPASAQEMPRYITRQMTMAVEDHKWPSSNRAPDWVWSQKVGGFWQVFKNGVQVTFAARNHERPVIGDSGELMYFVDATGGGIGYQVLRASPAGVESVIEMSSRNNVNGDHRDAGKFFGFASDGTSISSYTFFHGAPVRRFNASGIGELTDGSGGRGIFTDYDQPDINKDRVIAYTDPSGRVCLATTSEPFKAVVVDSGSFPRIADGTTPELVYIKDGAVWSNRRGRVDEGLWADVNDDGVVIYEKLVGAVSQIFVAEPDTDGDGLSDTWETNGFTASNNVRVDLPAMGAHPKRKDLFVQADWMNGLQPSPLAMRMVVDAFRQAPVSNPDGTTGIDLHVDCGPTCLMDAPTQRQWGGQSRGGVVPTVPVLGANPAVDVWSEVTSLKATRFAAAGRDAAFHYVVFGDRHQYLDGHGVIVTNGTGEADSGTPGRGGHDLIVTLGMAATRGGTLLQQAGTFMHELGHNLGLAHGGQDGTALKPNYFSVMNYAFQLSWLIRADGRRELNYSTFPQATLFEPILFEGLGLTDQYRTFWTSGTKPCHSLDFPLPAIDWDCDGQISVLPIRLDINGSGDDGDTLVSYLDWPALRFDGGGAIGDAGAAVPPPSPNAPGATEPPIDQLLDLIPPALRTAEERQPQAWFSASRFTGTAPLSVSFDGTSATDPDGQIASWQWDFGDGTTSDGPAATHVYAQPGTYLTTLDVVDNDGNRALFLVHETIIVTPPDGAADVTPPALFDVPPSRTVEQSGLAGTEVLVPAPGASDDRDPAARVTSDAPVVFPLGTTAVTFTATDSSGNTATTTTTVTVVDTTSPSLMDVPGAVFVEQDSLAGAEVALPLPTTVDACDASPLVVSDAPPVFPLGTTIITFKAVDASGNEATASTSVTVVDSRPPSLRQIPDPVQVEQVNWAGTRVALTMPIADDDCDASPTVTSDAPVVFPLGRTVVTFRAVDGSGNLATATTEVTVVDTTGPEVGPVVASPNRLSPPTGQMVPVAISLSAGDACDTSPVCQITAVTSLDPGDGCAGPRTRPDWQVTGALTLDLRARRSVRGPGRTYMITVSCVDASGNTRSRPVTVTVPHDDEAR